MTTEKQASQMVCPQTRTVQHPDGLTCIGSKCMKWRWLREEHSHTKDSAGYCGPAGKAA